MLQENEKFKSTEDERPSRPSLIPMVQTRSQTSAQVSSSNNPPGTVMSGNPFSVRKFDGRNFAVWKAQIETYLLIKDYYEAVVTERPSGASTAKEKGDREKAQSDLDEKNNVARAIILLSLNDDQAILVRHFRNAKDMWDRLLEAHQQHSQASRVVMQRQFFDTQMKDGEKLVDFVSRVQRIFSQIIDARVNMSEETFVGRIVAGPTPAFHVFMRTNNTGLRETMAELLPRLASEEVLIKKLKRDDTVAIASEDEQRNFRRPNSSFYRPNPKSDSKGPNDKKASKKKTKCHNCGKTGHWKFECRNGQGTSKDASKPTASDAEQQEVVIADGIVAESNVAIHDSDWILDSGASDHMTYDRSALISYRAFKNPRSVKLGDFGETEIEGIGDICMVADLGNSEKAFLQKNVLFVPQIRRKLISIGSATSNGNTGEITNNKILLKNKQGKLILQGIKTGRTKAR